MTELDQKETFTSWLHQHKALLYKVVRSYAFTLAEQDDLFQEICIQIWKSVPAYREESAVTTWMYRISLNTALKWRRNEKKHRENTSALDNQALLFRDDPKQADERVEWLYNQIALLNEIDRSLTLLMLDGFSYKETAGILGMTESNVGVKIHRIRKHLISQSEKD